MLKMPAEFEEQSFVQLIFPHEQSDWRVYLNEAKACFVEIAQAIARHQKCLIICDDIQGVKKHFEHQHNLYFIQYQSDDTWARDCSALSIQKDNEIQLLDFIFNGWGDKFDAKKDNALTQSITKHYSAPLRKENFILEGGSIESNGSGVILTTSACLLNKNRNPDHTKKEIEERLKESLGAQKVHWLKHGELEGDDTDAHIDTLARYISKDSIMHVSCQDEEDSHYKALKSMHK